MLCHNAKHTGCENAGTNEIVVASPLDQEALEALGLSALPPDVDDVIEILCDECTDEYVNEYLDLFENEILTRQDFTGLERVKTGNACLDLWRDAEGFACWENGARITSEEMEDEDLAEQLGPIIEAHALKIDDDEEAQDS